MPGRRKGVLLPLEEAILVVALGRLREGLPDFHGFALAEELESGHGGDRLLAFGTLYKALGRLERDGLLISAWEDVDPAVAGRPRRRLYRATSATGRALAHSRVLQEPLSKTTVRVSPA